MNVIESQQVLEWMAMGEAKGEACGKIKGEINGWIISLLEILAIRFSPELPANLEVVIRATTDREQLKNWFVIAIKADSLDAFRQAAGL